MSERDHPGARPGRQPAEGVRIIKAEEAQAALEAGEAAGRRPDDQLRFGDVPPAPPGPRPAHRFPLPDSVNPAEAVALPPLAPRPSVPPRLRGAGSAGEGDPTAGATGSPMPPEAGPARSEGPAAVGGPRGGSPSPEPIGSRYPDPPAPPTPPAHLPAAGAPGADATGAGPEPPDHLPGPVVLDGHEEAEGPPTASMQIPAEGFAVPPVRREPPPAPSPPVAFDPAPAFDPASRAEPDRAAEPAAGPEPGLYDPGRYDPRRDEAPRYDRPPLATDPAGAGAPPAPPRFTPPPTQSWAAATESATGGDDEVEADAPPWAYSGGTPAGSDRTTELAGIPEEGITVTGADTDMPHWSDPPTGEVPRLRFDQDSPDPEDMEAWRALGARGVRWRDEDGWDEGDELSDLAPDVEPVGALDQNRSAHSDLYSFDEDFERVTNRTGANPVVDLTDVDDEVNDDDWARVDRGTDAAAGRGGHRDRGRGSSGGRRGRRFVASSTAAGAAAAAAGAGNDAGDLGPRYHDDAEDGHDALSSAAVSAAAGPAAAGGSWSAGVGADPTVASGVSSDVGATRRVSTATRDNDRPIRPDRPGSGPVRRPPAGGNGTDVGNRVVVGAGLLVVLIIAYAIGAKALLILSAVIVVAAAAEAYNMTRGPGFRPATLLGLVATVGCVLGAYWKGVGAIPLVTVLLFGGTMLWYVLGVVEARPLANAAVTVMVFVWVSVMGSFSGVLLQAHDGKGLFLGAVIVAVAADVFAYGVGRWIGSRPMAPSISPHKTIEGFVGGVVGALIVGAIIGKTLHPWSGMRYGLILGLVIGLIAPAGDLFESMLKRDLGIKDSGRVLGGHGGLLDRFDGILLALPAAYFVATIAHII